MIVKIIRRWKKPAYTISEVWVDGEKQPYNVLEDTDRGLYQGMSAADVAKAKVYGQTAIPRGTYNCIYTWSTRFKRMLPLLENVTGFAGIRIHSGNTAKDTEGCLIVGRNSEVGRVTESRKYTQVLIDKMRTAWEVGERVTIKITDK